MAEVPRIPEDAHKNQENQAVTSTTISHAGALECERMRLPNDEMFEIFVGGLDDFLRRRHIWKYFSDLCLMGRCRGKVVNVTIAHKKGFGFVTFDCIDVADCVLAPR